ncbi:hypothetical protein Taro_034567 [Colocasia esculenta]|uniref:Uncharacterized protein n=1 Tax=Colocasia esculenta TaxID=4460 RepID=A0A843VY37_COLES|nr:hypothetical protein [Colocasia esculenta]
MSSWWLRSCGTPTPSCSFSPSRLLRPAQTVHFKSTKAPYVNIRQFWTAIQEHVCGRLVSAPSPADLWISQILADAVELSLAIMGLSVDLIDPLVD